MLLILTIIHSDVNGRGARTGRAGRPATLDRLDAELGPPAVRSPNDAPLVNASLRGATPRKVRNCPRVDA